MKNTNHRKEGGKWQDDRTSPVIAVIMRKQAETERLLNGLLLAFETHIMAAKTELLQKCDSIEASIGIIAQELAGRSRDHPPQ